MVALLAVLLVADENHIIITIKYWQRVIGKSKVFSSVSRAVTLDRVRLCRSTS